MASNKSTITRNNSGGFVSRLNTSAARKNLIKLDILIDDKSTYSPYYFNVAVKPFELKLGGNIFEFAPPRNRFKIGSPILFEVVDAQNNPLSYEILPKREGSQNVRICIFVRKTDVQGPAIISLVGEAIIDDCGCPIPEEWQDKPNVRWSCQANLRTDDISGYIEYDSAPKVSVSETKIPWTYQTFEDVYNIQPGTPGQPYTVSGSYTPTYNSEPTGSGTGKFTYDRDIEPNPATGEVGQGTIQVYFGNLRFSSSMVGGILYVSGGANHINGATPNPHPPTANFPAYYATISAVLNATTAEVVPAYAGFQYEIGNFYPRQFNAKNGARLTWTETSSSIAYTDPTAETSTITRVERTVEQHTSYIDINITGLKPICGIATDIEVYSKSNRLEGPLTKLTEFPIEPTLVNQDDTRTTEGGNTRELFNYGIFNDLKIFNTYWELAANKSNAVVTQGNLDSAGIVSNNLMNAVRINDDNTFVSSGNVIRFSMDPTAYTIIRQKNQYITYLDNDTNYFIEFDAFGDIATGNNGNTPTKEAILDVYISGSGVVPTNASTNDERVLGQFVGSVRGATPSKSGELFLGNSFEVKAPKTGQAAVILVVRTGIWDIANISINTAPGKPEETGITPNSIRTLIPMPAITKFNDQYTFEFRYKNRNGSANKISTVGAKQFEGNDPSAFLAGQPNQTILSPVFHGSSAVTFSKNVLVTGSVHVSGTIFSSEFHTNVVSSSIIFKEGDTIFGDTITDIHQTTGSVFITSSKVENVTNNYIIKRPEDDRVFTVFEGHVTQSGDIRVDKPGTTDPCIIIRPSDTAGQVDIKNGAGDTVLVIDDGDRNLYFFDKGDESISGDGTDLDIKSGNDIKLSPTTAVLVATDKPIRFGDSGENIQGDGTDITIASGNDIKLTPTTAVLVATDKPIRFGDSGENIQGDGTDLTIASGNDIKLTPTTAILVDTSKPIRFRDTALSINSPVDGQLDIVSDKYIRINSKNFTVTGSVTGSFISASGAITAKTFEVDDTISRTGDPDTQILFTDDDINIKVGNINMVDFTEDTVSEVTFNEAAADLDIRIESVNDQKAFYLDADKNAVQLGSSPNTSVTASGNISSSKNIISHKSIVGTSTDAGYSITVEGGIAVRGTGNTNAIRIDDSGNTSRHAIYMQGNILSIGNTNYNGVAVTGSFTASSAISASGLLFASASFLDLTGTTHLTSNPYQVVVYDSGSGRFYYTGSYGGGGSSGGGAAKDATITLTAGDGLATGGDFTTNQAADETITFDLDLNSLTDAAMTVGEDSIAFIDVGGSNPTRKEAWRDIIGNVAATGLGASTGQLFLNLGVSDATNAEHYVPFVDGDSGAQALETHNLLRYNPASGELKVGNSVHLHNSGSITASSNIWVSHSAGEGSTAFISSSRLVAAMAVTASNLGVFGSGKQGTGSFSSVSASGRASADHFVAVSSMRVGTATVFIDGAGHITASGNMSASGDDHVVGPLHILNGHVTASGNISSSGTFICKTLKLGPTILESTSEGVDFSPAVTISNASQQSPIAMNLPPTGEGSLLMWQRTSDAAPFGRMVVGTIRQTTTNPGDDASTSGKGIVTIFLDSTVPASDYAFGSPDIPQGTGKGKRGSIELNQAAFVGSPGIFISSGSITFYTSSVTSSIGSFGTQSATVRMQNLKGDDGTSFVITGSKAASIYFSGSTSGRVGIGTTDPQSDFEVAADEHVFRRRENLIGLKINEEGNIESFNKDAAFAATGSEVILSYTAGGSTSVPNSAFALLLSVGEEEVQAIIDDIHGGGDAGRTALFNTFKAKEQARLLQIAEKLGEFGVGASQVGDIVGAVRWVVQSGSRAALSDDALDRRRSGELATIRTQITDADSTGAIGQLQIRTSTGKSTGAVTRIEIKPNGTMIFSGSVNTYRNAGLFIGETAEDGYDRMISFRHATAPFVVGIDDSQNRFVINSAAAFGTTSDIEIDTSGNVAIQNGDVTITNNLDVDGTTNLDAVDIDGAVDIAGNLTFSGAGRTLANSTGDLTVDVEGDIILDVNGADIILKDDGTEFGRFKRDTSDFIIKSATNDKDIIFKGVDNSSTITALTLDMSEAGSATFNSHITTSGNINTTGIYQIEGVNAIDYASTTHLFGSNTSFTKLRSTKGIEMTAPVTASGNISASGDIIANRLILDQGDQSNPSLIFGTDTDTGIFRAGNDILSFQVGGGNVEMSLLGSTNTISTNSHLSVGSAALTRHVTASGNISSSGTIEASQYTGVPVVLANNSEYLGTATSGDRWYYGNNTQGWYHTMNNFITVAPETGVDTSINQGAQHNSFIVPFDVKDIEFRSSIRMNKNNSRGAFWISKKTRQDGGSSYDDNFLFMASASTVDTATIGASKFYNCDITGSHAFVTSMTASAGEEIYIFWNPYKINNDDSGAESTAQKWTWTLSAKTV